jgi:hypothetical protein
MSQKITTRINFDTNEKTAAGMIGDKDGERRRIATFVDIK